MIQSIMLITLGFLIATLLALVVAPSFWRRAERLTTRRLEQTMPMSIAETEADRDQLRAGYAIIIRRLEAALSQEKMRSARQLVKISRLEMEIASLKDQVGQLRNQLEAEHNATSVLRRTIATRVPELNRSADDAKQLVHVRERELGSLVKRLRHREEALAIAQRTTEMQQTEIARLRQAMEMSGAQNAGRFKMRPTQWTIHDYRAEYDRLNVELSKLRERLSVAYDREANQITQLRTELQHLADQVVSAALEGSDEQIAQAIPNRAREVQSEEHDAAGRRKDVSQHSERSIDAIIAGHSNPSEARLPSVASVHDNAGTKHTAQSEKSGLLRQAFSPRRLARNAVAKVTHRSGDQHDPTTDKTSPEKFPAERESVSSGRMRVAELLGGPALSRAKQNDTETPEPEPLTSARTDAQESPIADKSAGTPHLPSHSHDRDTPEAAPMHDASTSSQTSEEMANADTDPTESAQEQSAETQSNLYDVLRNAKRPAPDPTGKTTQSGSSASQEPSVSAPDSDNSQTGSEPAPQADEAREDHPSDEQADAEDDSSASSLIERLKEVPENQSK